MADASEVSSDWLIYNRQYNTLICRWHGYAVNGLKGHLKAKHPYLDRRARQELLSRHDGVRLLLPEPETMAHHGPDDPIEPVEGLTIHRGYACTYPFCQYRTTSWKTMRVHLNCQHGLKGKRALAESSTHAQLQTFLAGPKSAVSYFCVLPTSGGDRPRVTTADKPRGNDETLANIAKLWSEQKQEQEAIRTTLDAGELRHETSNWLNRTEWRIHTEGKDLRVMHESSRMPDRAGDRALKRLVDETSKLFFNRCIGGLRSMPLMMRSYLASPHPHDMDSRPFARLQEQASMEKYIGYMQRFLTYCLTIPYHTPGEVLDKFGARFTSRQVASLDQLNEYLDDEDCASEVLQEHILQVLAGFWMQQLPGSPFDSPLWHFVCVLAIDPDTWQFRHPSRFTYVLAGLMYCGRALLAEFITPTARRATMEDLHGTFLAAREKWLCKGTITPMGYLLSLHLYGRKIARETGSRLMVTWSNDGQTIYYRGKAITMDDIRQMVASMTADAEDLLWEQLMFREGKRDARFTIPLDQVQDDMTLTTRGKSFVHTNKSLQDKELEVLEDLLGSKRRATYIDRQGKWKEKGIMQYKKHVRKLEELLLLLCHFTGGQPSRGPEILGLRLANGITRDRSVFIVDGQVVLVTQYHKSLSHFDSPKVIPRYLPARVGQLLAMYMVYIRPLADRLEADEMDLYGQMTAPSDFIWHNQGNPWQSPYMSTIMARITGLHLSHQITIQHWRHIAIAISKKHARKRGGVMQADFEDGDEDEEEDWEEKYEQPDDLAAGHTSKTAEHYGVTMDIVKRLSTESLRVFSQVSYRWHAFLGCAPPPPERAKVRRKCHPDAEHENGCQAEAAARESPEVTEAADDDIKQALRKALCNPAAKFRSEQQERAIRCAAKKQSPLVIVLPTGSGKSLAFMVPALLPDAGITIVVAPYRLLKEQLTSRCKKAGIQCQQWPAARTAYPRVTLVSAEAAITDDFLQWAAELSVRGRLDRVVFDECHVIITAGETYRSKLRNLVHLRDLGSPCIFLTGTLPPSRQRDLEEAMHLPAPLYIRASSHRTDMRYRVHRVATGKDIMELLKLVRARKPHLKPGERGIIFCTSHNKCQAVARQLKCFWYHAIWGDEESHHLDLQRQQGFRDWLDGRGQYIAATGAMGNGLDFPGVVHIIHLGHPYSLVDYVQETGRGGRAGEPVEADIIIDDKEWPSEDKDTDRYVSPDVRHVNMFIRTKGCRRVQLGLYLDGDPRDCSRIDAIPCDGCLYNKQAWHSETSQEVHNTAKRRRREDAVDLPAVYAGCLEAQPVQTTIGRVAPMLMGLT
ncbi:uncharacterized protein FFFS_15811 [Fusarium fujikuroi]|nr:uncharacterized protein FFFS_15811 [Fusarium fujikuroi]